MIEVRNLTKTFGGFTAVRNLSFDVRRGEAFALLGPNGSGKTTTLKCLVGLSAPSSGEIRVDGLNAFTKSREARRLMSFLPQRLSFHDSLSAREVMEFYCRLRKLPLRRIDEVLNGSSFHFNGFTDRPVGEFSGGMVQRLGLAVACLPDAPILVLDEPTISLDPEGALRFRQFLAALKRAGTTILFSSHMLADVERLADRVAIMVGGELVALESVEALQEGLMATGRLRIAVSSPDPRLAEAALRAGAHEARIEGRSLAIASRPEDRLSILRALEQAGAQVAQFATQEPSLEDVYLRYIRDAESNSDH